MVRDGAEADIPAIVEMAREFWGHTIYDDEYCPDTVAAMAAMCLEHELMSVVEIDGEIVGFACGIKGALLGNAAVSSGTEIAWWVNPEHRTGSHGIQLLTHIEGRARDAGIKHWNMAFMVSSMPAVVESMYQRMGYIKTEVIYSKEL